MTPLTDDLALALTLADSADAITMRAFKSTFSVRTKDDRTPVTEVDEAVERTIRATLERERPDDGIIGEEFGAGKPGFSPARRWIIDPIDATRNFIRGIPVFGTLIALECGGSPPPSDPRRQQAAALRSQVGVISAPALNRRWWAARGEGAFCNGAPIRVSTIDKIADAQLSYDDLGDANERFIAFLRACGRTRAFGDFWSHMLVAEGACDIAVEPVVAHWDMAAVQVIVEEAGGRFTDYAGRARADGGSGVSTNGLLHEEVLRWLSR